MGKNSRASSESQDGEKSHGLRNIVNLIILIAVLVGAWYLLDWLINAK